MDNSSDDRGPGLPEGVTPEEMEDALRWLEELAARQGKKASELTDADDAPTVESPFLGLIESQQGDLPDWLREVPAGGQYPEGELESRLDWLAKMAQRESIEELPTLEWRRLSEPPPSGSAALPPQRVPIEEDDTQPFLMTPLEDDEVEAVEVAAAGTSPEDAEIADGAPAPREPEPAEPLIVMGAAALAEIISPREPEADSGAEPAEDVDEVGPAEPGAIRVYTDAQSPSGEEMVAIDDLDAAMAWIEELATSQEGPIEDLPSVADRALASKLLMEAMESQMEPLPPEAEELSMDTPVLAIVETGVVAVELADEPEVVADEAEAIAAESEAVAEPLEADNSADVEVVMEETEVVIEEVAADIESDDLVDGAAPADVEVVIEETEVVIEDGAAAAELDDRVDEAAPADDEVGEADVEMDSGFTPAWIVAGAEAPPELSFDEAMAFLDQMAEGQPEAEADHDLLKAVALAAGAGLLADELADEEADAADVDAVALDVDEAAAVEALAVEASLAAASATQHSALESALRHLDELALPAGVTLDVLRTSLHAQPVEALPPRRDPVETADWLESLLAKPNGAAPTGPADLSDEELIELMPEDPDEALAWLESIAGEEAGASEAPQVEARITPVVQFEASEPASAAPVEELVAADLLEMPEDPDAAMAWLESMAAGGAAAVAVARAVDDEPEPAEPTPEAPVDTLIIEEVITQVLTEETVASRKAPAGEHRQTADTERDVAPSGAEAENPTDALVEENVVASTPAPDEAEAPAEVPAPKPRKRRSRRRKTEAAAAEAPGAEPAVEPEFEPPAASAEADAQATSAAAESDAVAAEQAEEPAVPAEATTEAATPRPRNRRTRRPKTEVTVEEPPPAPEPEPPKVDQSWVDLLKPLDR